MSVCLGIFLRTIFIAVIPMADRVKVAAAQSVFTDTEAFVFYQFSKRKLSRTPLWCVTYVRTDSRVYTQRYISALKSMHESKKASS